MHGVHLQQPLSGEAAFAEQVLIDLGAGRTVGIDTAFAGEQTVEGRVLVPCRQRRDDPRLQDAVAADHARARSIQSRLVVRMRGHAHQFTQAAGGQLGVAVQGDEMARARSDQ